MDFIVNYLFESALILGLLTAVYWLLLQRETCFKFNRFFLLFALTVAAFVPLLSFSFTIENQSTNSDVYVGNILGVVSVYAQQTKATLVPLITQSSAFQWLYLVGFFGLLIRLLFGFIRLGGLAGKVQLVRFKGYKVADLPGQFNPFSFFNVVFINQSRYSQEEVEQIMIHELTHVRLKHSWDVLVLELLLIVQWFNPFAWLLRIMLKELHEFQADKQVLDNGYSAKSYKELLLFQATGVRLLPVNSFNQSLTKKRFTMMKKDKFQNMFGLKSVFAIVSVVLISVLFAFELKETDKELSPEEQEIQGAVANSNVQKVVDIDDEPTFFVVEDMPQYPGGEEALRQYIAQGVKYPEEAQSANLSGRVYVTFIVSKDGSVKGTKIARSSGYTVLDDEAIRVVKEMPDWKPGKQRGVYVNVSYTVPINFALK